MVDGRENTMCLAIPMQVKEIDGFTARCEAKRVYRDVNLFLLQHAHDSFSKSC